jgi:hypothetical protein
MYMWKQHNETHQALKEGQWEYNEGGELVKGIAYTLWNYHNEIPLYY